MSYEAKVKELTRAVEDGKPKLQQYAVTLEEKEELISSLQNTVGSTHTHTHTHGPNTVHFHTYKYAHKYASPGQT